MSTYKIKNKQGKEEEVNFYGDDDWTCSCSYFSYERHSNRRQVECYHVKKARIRYNLDTKKEHEEYIVDEKGNRLGKIIIH